MNIDTIILGGGCFWCIEALFKELDGVIKIVSGYSGGNPENPTYEEICTGNTGHAEVCEIEYDKNRINKTKHRINNWIFNYSNGCGCRLFSR